MVHRLSSNINRILHFHAIDFLIFWFNSVIFWFNYVIEGNFGLSQVFPSYLWLIRLKAATVQIDGNFGLSQVLPSYQSPRPKKKNSISHNQN